MHPRPTNPLNSRDRTALAVRTAMAVLVALCAFSVFGAPAEAAPPLALTATPNPVTIPYGQNNGPYTLSWSTGSSLPAEFRYSINGGPDSAVVHQPSTGSGVVPIGYGATITWKLFTKGLQRPLKTVTVTTRRPDQSCLGQCIKSVEVTPHGTFADVHVVATSKLKTFEITAYKTGEPVSSAMIGWNTSNWQTMLLSLDPGTTYFYDLTVRDEAGNKQTASGNFTTLKRKVSVDFDNITVTDDSDDLSEGDLRFWFHQDGDWTNSFFGEIGMDTGDSVDPNAQMSKTPAPDEMKLAIYGNDDDCSGLTLCSEGVGPGGANAGSTDEQDWATAWTTIHVAVSGPGESFSDTFSMSTSGNALAFHGSGTFTVTYV